VASLGLAVRGYPLAGWQALVTMPPGKACAGAVARTTTRSEQ